jgi:hypothetical protein
MKKLCYESKTSDKGDILLDRNLVFGMKRGLMRGTSPQMKIFENKIHFGKNACFISAGKNSFRAYSCSLLRKFWRRMEVNHFLLSLLSPRYAAAV